jgi:hypothetical protein
LEENHWNTVAQLDNNGELKKKNRMGSVEWIHLVLDREK